MGEQMPSAEFEKKPLSPEKQELYDLEAEDKYFFSGTDVDVAELEPRQAMDTETGPDGVPAVFASSKADMAIFSALLKGSNVTGGSSTVSFGNRTSMHDDGATTDRLHFAIRRDTAENLKDSASGWIYVLDRSKFVPHPDKPGVEFVSYTPVAPIKKIKVLKRDLPDGIEIFD
ncbi:MAG: hypothetical protein JWN18_383 [Parcubacteria group bacterium]|nr:hypothetical protein [Parcubacteria group bacterium]